IVVPGQADGRAVEHARYAQLGIRAVAHKVAQAPDLVDARLLGVDRREYALEGGKVAVDVGDDGGPHGIATLLAPCAAPSCSSWWRRSERCCCGRETCPPRLRRWRRPRCS